MTAFCDRYFCYQCPLRLKCFRQAPTMHSRTESIREANQRLKRPWLAPSSNAKHRQFVFMRIVCTSLPIFSQNANKQFVLPFFDQKHLMMQFMYRSWKLTLRFVRTCHSHRETLLMKSSLLICLFIYSVSNLQTIHKFSFTNICLQFRQTVRDPKMTTLCSTPSLFKVILNEYWVEYYLWIY